MVYLFMGMLLLTVAAIAGAHFGLMWLFREDGEASDRPVLRPASRDAGIWRAFVLWRRGKPPLIADRANPKR
ncbi:hypothetical protein [Sphingosinicella humi]|uniref:Uncharacterized protein n=1 Tax=Allosphingosinicella humi TaxID=2068657 RepID=A0A2U2J4Z7_9SPHN|nr:hypothetical protein [Sphingosinicella humi]PWG03420.1 hypothetical protein DF286_11480 [Sphingosinicella humi]